MIGIDRNHFHVAIARLDYPASGRYAAFHFHSATFPGRESFIKSSRRAQWQWTPFWYDAVAEAVIADLDGISWLSRVTGAAISAEEAEYATVHYLCHPFSTRHL
eukprot:IDg6102t1